MKSFTEMLTGEIEDSNLFLQEGALNEGLYDTIIQSMDGVYVKNLKVSDYLMIANAHKKHYYFEGQTPYSIDERRDNITIVDLTNALQRGKSVEEYYIETNTLGANNDISNKIIRPNNMEKWSDLVKYIKDNKGRTYLEDEDITVTCQVQSIKGQDVLSPFSLHKLKRLTKEPTKWKKLDLLKAIANGQFHLISSNYQYTDDYAFDAAYDFQKADGIDPIVALEDIFRSSYDSNSAGRIYANVKDGVTSVNYGSHSNESYTLIFNLKGKHKIKLKESEILIEALDKKDKVAIDAFIEKKESESNNVFSDGGELKFGGAVVAKWEGNKITLSDVGTKSQQDVQKYLKKETPSNKLNETGGKEFSFTPDQLDSPDKEEFKLIKVGETFKVKGKKYKTTKWTISKITGTLVEMNESLSEFRKFLKK
jgi:hypothetical protein